MRLEALGAAAPHLREDSLENLVVVVRPWRRVFLAGVEIALAVLAIAAVLAGWR